MVLPSWAEYDQRRSPSGSTRVFRNLLKRIIGFVGVRNSESLFCASCGSERAIHPVSWLQGYDDRDLQILSFRIFVLNSSLDSGRFPSPDCPSRSVLNRDSPFRELTSYLVSLRKVLDASGLVPLFDQSQ